MKVYERIVIQDGVVVEEDWYEYEGPVAQCGGGGGSAAGQVGYPDYLETFHKNVLNHNALDLNIYSLTDVMNDEFDNSPYAAAAPYDPDAALTDMGTAYSDLEALIAGLGDDTWIADDVAAFTAIMDVQLNGVVFPKFEAGMRDINAVSSSAFAMGRAVLEDARLREITKYTGELQKLFNMTVRDMRMKYQAVIDSSALDVEKLRIVVKSDQVEKQLEWDSKDSLWNISLFQYAGNLMAAPAGGTLIPEGPSRSSRMLGGALSGAAGGGMMGYMAAGASSGAVGGLPGALIGGLLGLGLGIGSSFM